MDELASVRAQIEAAFADRFEPWFEHARHKPFMHATSSRDDIQEALDNYWAARAA